MRCAWLQLAGGTTPVHRDPDLKHSGRLGDRRHDSGDLNGVRVIMK